MIEAIETHRAKLEDLCRKHHVKRLELFGSAADGSFDPARSDLDFLVDFLQVGMTLGAYFGLKEDLQHLFGCKVDLVMPRAIRNRYLLEAVNKQRQPVYAA